VSIRPTTFAKYEYDGLNSRVKKHIDTGGEAGVDTYRHFFYNTGWQILETRKSTTENTAPQDLEPEYQYVWSARYIDAPILRDKNTDEDGLCDDERIYYTTDANMNVTALFSAAGVALERYTYDAYGHTSVYDPNWDSDEDGTDYDNVILFAGYYRDPETWFYHVRNRFYHAELGRWHQRDPIGYTDGMSLYEYVGSSPVVNHDPTGLITPSPIEYREMFALNYYFGGGEALHFGPETDFVARIRSHDRDGAMQVELDAKESALRAIKVGFKKGPDSGTLEGVKALEIALWEDQQLAFCIARYTLSWKTKWEIKRSTCSWEYVINFKGKDRFDFPAWAHVFTAGTLLLGTEFDVTWDWQVIESGKVKVGD